MLTRLSAEAIDSVVVAALMEDAPSGDITSQALIPRNARVAVQLVAREEGILSGEDVFRAAMSIADPAIETTFTLHDGNLFTKGSVLANIQGSAQAVLRAERVALNFIQRMCGIATLTAKYVAEVAGTKARIVDTRKTTPGLRLIERYAVRCGGGHNHRFSLSDAVMVKDNHLAIIASHIVGRAPRSITESLRDMRQSLSHTTHVEVEVDHLDQIEAVLAADVDTILLDNFTTADLREAIRIINGRTLIEASGGITLANVREVAVTGVDIISIGALTQNVRCLDLGLDIQTV
jgi:nicotinate-nucleotide pyrophosphorylase (carboxylating)